LLTLAVADDLERFDDAGAIGVDGHLFLPVHDGVLAVHLTRQLVRRYTQGRKISNLCHNTEKQGHTGLYKQSWYVSTQGDTIMQY